MRYTARAAPPLPMTGLSLYSRLLRYVRPYRWAFGLAVLGMMIVAAGDLMLAWLVIPIVRNFESPDPSGARWLPRSRFLSQARRTQAVLRRIRRHRQTKTLLGAPAMADRAATFERRAAARAGEGARLRHDIHPPTKARRTTRRKRVAAEPHKAASANVQPCGWRSLIPVKSLSGP